MKVLYTSVYCVLEFSIGIWMCLVHYLPQEVREEILNTSKY